MGNIFGNDKKKEFFDSLERLMVPLEYLARKSNNYQLRFLYDSEKYRKTYLNLSENELINLISKNCGEFNNNLNIILNSGKCEMNECFNSFEINGYLKNIIYWKQCCPKYANIFTQIENFFIQIRNKYLELNKNITQPLQYNELNNGVEEYKEDNYDNNEQIVYQNYQAQEQQQILINKQKVIQAQELTLLNDNFGRALASLECFANRFSGKILSNVFGYYDMFNLGKTQDMVELQKKAFLQTQIFKLAYEDYIRKYGAYDIPSNINIEYIKNLINLWFQNVSEEYKFMYQGMFNTISSLKNDIFNKNFQNYSEQVKDAQMDPTKIASFAPCVFYYNQQRCEEAKNQYLEEGTITSTLNINQTYTNDKNAEQMEQQILLNQNLIKEQEEMKDLK